MLRSSWCRSLTGEVLLLGRSAYPYVAVDRDEPGALVDLLTAAQGEVLAEPSTPRPVRTPAARYPATGAIPEASRMLDEGQWATPVRVSANHSTPPEPGNTAWANHTSLPAQFTDSA